MQGVYNVFFHPLRKFPGPLAGRISEWYRTWIEVFRGRCWIDELEGLHGVYGEFWGRVLFLFLLIYERGRAGEED